MPSKPKPLPPRSELLAYVVGLALGDGNLSSPNGRAARLRITCDATYPVLAKKIIDAIRTLLPYNKVSVVQKTGRCFDVSCYSRHWESLLEWQVGKGSKIEQNVRVPSWIKGNREYVIYCLRGLLETDGSVYLDRGYPMVMFVSAIPELARDAYEMIRSLGFSPHVYQVPNKGARHNPYHVRLSKRVAEFLDLVRPTKL